MNVQEEEIFRVIRGTEVLEVHNSNFSVPLKPLPPQVTSIRYKPKNNNRNYQSKDYIKHLR